MNHSNLDDFYIKNPFFNRLFYYDNNEIKLYELNYNDILKYFKRIYILTIKNNEFLDNNFYNDDLNIKDIKKYLNKFEIFESDFSILKNKFHFNQLIVLDKKYLEFFNIKSNYELLLPFININKNNFNIYNSQFNNFKLKEYLTIKKINNFYNNKTYNNYLKIILNNLESSNYWTTSKYFNITKIFMSRELQYSKNISNNYLEDISNNLKKKYIDISSIINIKGHNTYKISDNSNYYNISDDIFNFILENINLKELYDFSLNIIISKNYCHYIKNKNLLTKLNNFNNKDKNISLFENFKLSYQYAFSYCFIILILEEYIKNTFIDESDRFIFDIESASMLPYFPVNITHLYNPYLPVLVAEEVLNLESNFMGVEINKEMKINDLNNFKKNLNIFITGDENDDIFKNLNFNFKNFAISGSAIPACVVKYNPLMDMCQDKKSFFDKYYKDSDIDILSNIDNDFDFISEVNILKSEIDKKYNIFGNIKYLKSGVIIVNKKFLDQNFFEYNKNKLNDDDKIVNTLYKLYVENKINDNIKYSESFPDKWTNKIYNIYFDILNKENIKILLSNNDDNEIKFNENIKIKIKYDIFNREFEIFRIKYKNFFSSICNFHLACVRGYYNFDNVYLLPSCVCSNMTLICHDIKYFSGNKYPYEIINKYRQRGYSILLNNNEIINCINDSYHDNKWWDYYNNFDINNKHSITKNVLGYINIHSKFFKNKYINKNYNNNNNNKSIYEYINSLIISNKETGNNINYKIYENLFSLLDFKVINEFGYINNINKWYFDLLFEKFR